MKIPVLLFICSKECCIQNLVLCVFLQFQSLSTELNHDEISIWIGGPTQAASTLLKRVSGSVMPSKPIYSNNNFMILSFTADSSVSDTGFQASWTAGIGCLWGLG